MDIKDSFTLSQGNDYNALLIFSQGEFESGFF